MLLLLYYYYYYYSTNRSARGSATRDLSTRRIMRPLARDHDRAKKSEAAQHRLSSQDFRIGTLDATRNHTVPPADL